MDILEYIKQMQEMYGEDVITTADKLERPPKADGGQLVAPSVDGSRPGYQGEESTLKAYDKNFNKMPPKIRKQFTEVTKYLEEIIPKLNASEKYVTKEQVSSMVEKKFNIKPKYKMVAGKKYKVNKFDPDSYPIMNNLDSVNTKIENTLKNMLIENKPLKNFWHLALQERTGLDQRTIWGRINDSPTYKVIKDQGALSLKDRFNKTEVHSFLKDYSFSDQLTQALEMEKGMPRFTGMGAEKMYTYSPKFRVMDFAKRNFHQNQGNGAVKFYNKNGKPIKWTYGLELPYKEVYFTYNKKKYSASDKIKNTNNLTNIEILKKNFPEVYKNQTAINNLRIQKIDNPFGKGKITLGELVKKIQVDTYQWGKGGSTFDILHGLNGVKGEPFTNLSFNTRDINQIEMGIVRDKTLSKTQKNNLVKSLYSLTGSGDPKKIEQRIIDLTGDIKSGKITSYEDVKTQLLDNFWCGPKKASGGRIGFANGSGCPDSVKQKNFLKMTNDVGKGRVTGEAAEQIAKNAAKVVTKAGSKSALASIFGPAGFGIDIAYEVGSIGFDMATDSNVSLKGALQNNWLTGAFIKGTGQEEYNKGLVKFDSRAKPIATIQNLIEKIESEEKNLERMKTSLVRGDYSGEAKKEILAKQEALIKNLYNDFDKVARRKNEGPRGENVRYLALENEGPGKQSPEIVAFNRAKQEYDSIGAARTSQGQDRSIDITSSIDQTMAPEKEILGKYTSKAKRPTLLKKPSKHGFEQMIKKGAQKRPVPFIDYSLLPEQYGKFSKKELDKQLKKFGDYYGYGYTPYGLGYGMQQMQPGIGDMKYNKDLGYREVADALMMSDAWDNLSKGAPNMADGGRAGYMGGGVTGIRKPSAIPPESGPQSQGLASLKKYGSYY